MMKKAALLLFAIAMPSFAQESAEEGVLRETKKEEAIPSPAPAVGARFDCTHDPVASTQSCLAVSGLRLGIAHYFSPRLSARVILDAFGTPLSTLRDTPLLDPNVHPLLRDTRFGLVESYAVDWRFRPYLKLSMQSFGGTTDLPSVSRLALADRFEDGGWDQTALTATYLVPALDGVQALFAVGNGEGENGVNEDPQQYAGVAVTIGVKRGVKMKFGASFDGNNTGSAAYDWQYGKAAGFNKPRTGFSADRKAAAIWLDGNLPSARGLMLGVGWQENTLKDLDRAAMSIPSGFFENPDVSYDLNQVLVEDPSGATANTIKRSVFSVSASYLILAEHFIGVGYQARSVHSDIAAFQTDQGALTKDIAETATTLGFGTRLDDGLVLSAEYQWTAYDRLYQYFHQRDRSGTPSREGELFNLRLAYNWD